MAEFHLHTPLNKKVIQPLRIGDIVYFSGLEGITIPSINKTVAIHDIQKMFTHINGI